MARKKTTFRPRNPFRVRTSFGIRRDVSLSNAIARLLPVASIVPKKVFQNEVKKYTPLHPIKGGAVAPTRPVYHFNILDPFKSVCKERKIRREVLFANHSVGKGIKIHTKKTFSIRSNIRCK